MRFLVDGNTFRHPAVSMWEHRGDELLMWGPTLIASRHYKWRHKPPGPTEIDLAKEIPFVPALGLNARTHGIEFFTYQLLELESWLLPGPIDWARRSIRDLFCLKSLRTKFEYNGVVLGQGTNLRDVLKQHTNNIRDDRLQAIVKQLGKKHSQDALHIRVCEEHGLDGIVTLDGRLRRHFRTSNKRLRSSVQVLFPSELCRMAGISPVGDDWFQEGSRDPFSNQIVLLFQRRASRMDRLVFAGYKALRWVQSKSGIEVKFVIPGY